MQFIISVFSENPEQPDTAKLEQPIAWVWGGAISGEICLKIVIFQPRLIEKKTFLWNYIMLLYIYIHCIYTHSHIKQVCVISKENI